GVSGFKQAAPAGLSGVTGTVAVARLLIEDRGDAGSGLVGLLLSRLGIAGGRELLLRHQRRQYCAFRGPQRVVSGDRVVHALLELAVDHERREKDGQNTCRGFHRCYFTLGPASDKSRQPSPSGG